MPRPMMPTQLTVLTIASESSFKMSPLVSSIIAVSLSVVPGRQHGHRGPVPAHGQGVRHLGVDRPRVHADALDQVPREALLHQELGLLSFLHGRPLCCGHGGPINLVKLGQIGPVLEVVRARVGQREGPAPAVGLRPRDGVIQVGFKVHDRLLPALVGQLGVALVDQEQHHRAWAEVERRALPDIQPGVAVQRQLGQPALLDVAHADDGARRCLKLHFGVGQQAPGHDGRQTVHMTDVIDLGPRRYRHGQRLRTLAMPCCSRMAARLVLATSFSKALSRNTQVTSPAGSSALRQAAMPSASGSASAAVMALSRQVINTPPPMACTVLPAMVWGKIETHISRPSLSRSS
mmetsp:Transcript_41607/g.97687  ORF Transcript_41607/g.97687 Transcript_41607/m.97687 type:complete len:348 (-) Transcript_41607:6528-7571(-)